MKRLTLFKKILLSMLLLSLLPLFVSSIILSRNLSATRERLAEKAAEIADRQSSFSLEMRAKQVAENVAKYLEECEEDLRLVASLPDSPKLLLSFYENHNSEIWYRTGTDKAPREVRERVPRYSALELLDATGNETFAIRDGRIVPPRELRNVAEPARTLYRSEDYFRRASKLQKGEIHVSHVTGFHISKEEQLAGAPDPERAVSGKSYRGVVRFATPRYVRGKFAGVAVLSLDHRHLMEFTQHIVPAGGEETVFPSYESGNYAFLFDDEGWIITHPKFWDIRGVDAAGRLVPPYSSTSPREDVDKGRIPYNLDHAGFIHPKYPAVAAMIREKRSGSVDITNVGGAKKIMAFAPILYDTGDYARFGVFGAVTIGFQADQFHENARTGARIVNDQLREHIRESILIIAITCVVVVLCAWLLSRGITRPLALLTEGARELADGETGLRVKIDSRDEIGELAEDFNRMAEELEHRKNSLLETLEKLRSSRREIMDERNFKEGILESISSGILTISPEGLLTSINGTGNRILGKNAQPGAHYSSIFSGWTDMSDRISAVLSGTKGYGREPLVVEKGAATQYFEIGFFPIGGDENRGITLTLRDETEKQRMREEITRMDRFASLGKLSAGIAHEVRNPLTGVSLLLDDLHDRASLDSDSQAMMRQALAEIERVEKLIAALLNYSSPPRAEFRTADLGRIVGDTVLLLNRQCENQGVELRLSAGEIPPFRFDPEKIKQALLNVVKNALEALPEGGRIEVSAGVEGREAVIHIGDNGPGILRKDLPLLFEPFFSRKGAGTGLGLSITQRIMEEHHGSITVETAEGAGTTFILTLPMEPSASA
jgi:signal transduction histidine kinase